VTVASAARTTTGDTGTLDGYSAVSRGIIQLSVTAASGTTPSFTFVINSYWESEQEFRG